MVLHLKGLSKNQNMSSGPRKTLKVGWGVGNLRILEGSSQGGRRGEDPDMLDLHKTDWVVLGWYSRLALARGGELRS